jgi:sulfur-oxidizing protein SoxY
MKYVTRRQTLAFLSWAAALMLPWRPAFAHDLIADFTGGKTPASGRIEFDIPFTADNAASVPVGIRVDSPMTAENFCSEILIVAEKNPRPKVCSFRFEPGPGLPYFSTRIRLAESQNVQVFAKMNDGSVYVSRRAVTVTTGACAPGG